MLPITEVSVTTTAASPIDKKTSLTMMARMAIRKPDRSFAFVFMPPAVFSAESSIAQKL
jgi:hypothetical protein